MRVKSESGQAIIEVEDNGIGIAPEHLAQIFQPFFRVSQTTNDGAGLGLNITQKIVSLHGGEISVQSEIGRGSCFTVRLAMVNPSAED